MLLLSFSYDEFCLPAIHSNVRVGFKGRVRNFWQRVSEGRAIDDLWRLFAADARAGYGFYRRDVDWEKIRELPVGGGRYMSATILLGSAAQVDARTAGSSADGAGAASDPLRTVRRDTSFCSAVIRTG